MAGGAGADAVADFSLAIVPSYVGLWAGVVVDAGVRVVGGGLDHPPTDQKAITAITTRIAALRHVASPMAAPPPAPHLFGIELWRVRTNADSTCKAPAALMEGQMT